MNLERRIEALERRAGGKKKSGWSPPIFEVWPGDDPAEVEARLEAIYQEARAAGYSFRFPYVVIVKRCEVQDGA